MRRLPVLFISHGSPMLAIDRSPAHDFLLGLGKTFPKPKAILVASAHWETIGEPAVSLTSQPETIHDFGGFPRDLFEIQYPAPGAPEVAERARSLLQAAGFAVKASSTRGLDHGAWVPLRLMYPKADIPVFQVSVLQRASPAEHFRLGQALAALRDEGVLIIGSGSITHNLYEFRGHDIDADVPEWVNEFDVWMKDRLEANDAAAVLNYREVAPSAVRNHPSEEHISPLFVAMGAAGDSAKVTRLHGSYEYGVLGMDTYAFH